MARREISRRGSAGTTKSAIFKMIIRVANVFSPMMKNIPACMRMIVVSQMPRVRRGHTKTG